MAIRPCAPRKRSTMSGSPPRPPPLLTRAIIEKVKPPAHIQKPAAARRGNARERAPSCIGTTATQRPIASGNNVPNTSPTLCASRIWAIAPSLMLPMPLRSIPRITLMATVPRRPSRPPPRNNLPIFLWSADVSQSAAAASRRPSALSPASTPEAITSAVGSMVVIRSGAHLFRSTDQISAVESWDTTARDYLPRGESSEITARFVTDGGAHVHKLLWMFVGGATWRQGDQAVGDHHQPYSTKTSSDMAPKSNVTYVMEKPKSRMLA